MFDYHAMDATSAEEALAAFRAAYDADGYYSIEAEAWDAAQLVVVRGADDPVALAELEPQLGARAAALTAQGGAAQVFEAFALYRPMAEDERRVCATVEVSAEQLAETNNVFSAIDLVAAGLAAELMAEGEFFLHAYTVGRRVQPRFETVRVESTSPVQTRYFVMERGGGFARPPMQDQARWTDPTFAHFEQSRRWNGWEAGHVKLEDAQAELSAILARAPQDDTLPQHVYNIVGQTRREDGTPIDTAGQVMVGATAEVEFTFVHRGEQWVPDGWFIHTALRRS